MSPEIMMGDIVSISIASTQQFGELNAYLINDELIIGRPVQRTQDSMSLYTSNSLPPIKLPENANHLGIITAITRHVNTRQSKA